MKSVPEMRLSLLVVIEKDQNNYHAYAPALKGLHVDGATKEEALKNAGQAASVYLDCLSRNGEPLPVGPHLILGRRGRSFQNPKIPRGALLKDMVIQWPFRKAFGTS